MTAEDELARALAALRRTRDVLPFMREQIPTSQAVFRRIPDAMLDLLATSPDFTPPERAAHRSGSSSRPRAAVMRW
jgi:hypothetical protein